MTSKQTFKFIWKLKFLILLTTFLALIGSYLAYQKANLTPFQNTVFFSIGAQSKTTGTSSYENLQAADQFTESVQGWFRDPGFLEKINSLSGQNFALNARKQEKNNLLITFNSSNQEQGIKHANSISQTLQTAITTYSQNSDTNFNLALQNQNFTEQSANILFYLLIGLFAGLIFPIALIWLYSEYFSANK
jgi:capsular polysaccharide biosynthesis protein